MPTSAPQKAGLNGGAIAGIVIASLAGVAFLGVLYSYIQKNKQASPPPLKLDEVDEDIGGFDDENKAMTLNPMRSTTEVQGRYDTEKL